MNQEEFTAKLERDGPEAVRLKLSAGGPIPHYQHPYSEWAAQWLGAMDHQRLSASNAFHAEQAAIAREAASAASRAAAAAEVQAAAAKVQAVEARRANRRATIALAIAAISAIITIIGIITP